MLICYAQFLEISILSKIKQNNKDIYAAAVDSAAAIFYPKLNEVEEDYDEKFID